MCTGNSLQQSEGLEGKRIEKWRNLGEEECPISQKIDSLSALKKLLIGQVEVLNFKRKPL